MRRRFPSRSLAFALGVATLCAATLTARAVPRRVAAIPSFRAVTLPGAGGEPNISISPSGRTILADGLGDASPASLWRSTDSGKTFAPLKAAFPKTGGGDWDMRFLDERHVIAVDLALDDGIYVHRSSDAGSTWQTTTIKTDVYDRPWVDHFGLNKIYVVAKGFDGLPYLYTSTDGGATFGAAGLPIVLYGTDAGAAALNGDAPNPVEAYGTNQDAYVDHITVDQRTGDVYVLYGIGGENSYANHPPTGVSNRLYVARLQTNAAGMPAMVSHKVHLGGPDESFISGFNWMTVDSAGTVYVLANGARKVGSVAHHSAWLSFSKDRGATWSPLVDVAPPGAANVYGSIAGGGPGVLSLVYLRGSNENPSSSQNWYAEMSRITAANTARPGVYRTRPVAKPIHTKDICFDGILCGFPGFGDDRALLDYIWNAVGPDGRAWAVVSSDGPATGGGNVSVILLQQSGGVSHGRGVQS